MGEAGPGIIDCVGALVVDAEGRTLLVRRRNPPGAGLWSLPGGRVEPGESDVEAVAREVAEETGLVVEVGPWVGTVRRDAPDGRVFDIRDHHATPVGGTLTPGDDATDARFVDPAQWAAMDDAGELVPGLTEALTAWGRLPPRHGG